MNALGKIKNARLYVGENDIEMDGYEISMGKIAVAVAACFDKPGAGEDAAAIIPLNENRIALAIADGVGGSPSARKASATAVECLRNSLNQINKHNERPRTAILDGMEAANDELCHMGTGSATTLVVADIQENKVRTFHVGDSAAWLIGQRGVIKFQTIPHSPVGFGVEAGLIDVDEALKHDELHIINNVIGSNEMTIEMSTPTIISKRDTLLLASDGLFDNLLQDEIINIVRKGPIEKAMGNLLELANQRMQGMGKEGPSKPDDFSAILFRLH